MKEEARMTAEPLPCPMCGTLVEVVSSGEGTNSYRPVARTADPGGLRLEYDEQYQWLVETDGDGASRIVARDVSRLHAMAIIAALTPEATAPGLCVERGGTEPCTHHAGSGPVHPGPALTGAKPLPALTPEATAPEWPDRSWLISHWVNHRCGYVDCRTTVQHEHGGGEPMREGPEATAPEPDR